MPSHQSQALRPHSNKTFDVHLMIAPVDPYVPEFAAAGADIITFHPEAGPHAHRTVQLIKSLGKKAGISLNPGTPVDVVDYLLPNLTIAVSFHDGKAVGIELPNVVEMTVVETEPGIKSATASSVTKPAKLETGLVVQVPPFINEGEKIRVDTAEGAYMSRA